MQAKKSLFFFIAMSFSSCCALNSQTAFVNTVNDIYELKDGAGYCSFTPVSTPCGPDGLYLDIALFKDTLYYMLTTGQLKRFKLGTPGSCESLAQVERGNAMTVDKNGILYIAGGSQLSAYNPYTNQLTTLGIMPFQSSGDLIFYKDKLLLAGLNPGSPGSAIFEINISNPSASSNYMSTDKYIFFGLVSFPVSCSKSRFFGLAASGASTEMVELDLENKKVLGTCSMPLEVYDAASSTENGYDDNVLITHLSIYPPCIPMTTADVEITSFYPSQGSVTYKLDNNISNTTGIFPGVPAGTHTITAIAPSGRCSKDTTFNISSPGMLVNHIDVRQSHCNLNNGWIKINLNINPEKAYSSINNGPFLHTLEYFNMVPGNYNVQVKNGPNCYFDTIISIQNINDAKPQIELQTNNQLCFTNNGSVHLTVTGNDPPYSSQLNNGGFKSENNFTELAPGNYLIDVKNNFDCQWDTFTVVAPYTRYPVSTHIEYTNPTCRGINDGTIKVKVTGTQNPYYFLVNRHWYNNGQTITGLTEGNHLIQIKNGDLCSIDSISQVLKINFEPGCNDVFIPNAFTPNNDGKNDLFRPVYSYFIKNITLRIYNRFGQKLFEGSGANISWDGKYNGAIQPPEAYVYTLNYTDYYGKPKFFKGVVTLIR